MGQQANEQRRRQLEDTQRALRWERERLLHTQSQLRIVQEEQRQVQDPIQSLGTALQRTIWEAPLAQRPAVKKKLLLCFHPDKNPATDVATRVTQILNRT